MSLLKSEQEIELLKQGGKILSTVLRTVSKQVRPGITTDELDKLAEELIVSQGGRPSFKGYGEGVPFPATLCTSVNEQVVHGVPGGYILKEGDIISLDIGMQYPKDTGLYTDMAVTVPVGKIDKQVKELIKVTKKSLDIWINNIKPGKNLYEIAGKVQRYIEDKGFGVVRDMVGHGVGHAVHEEPAIPNYEIKGTEFILKKGMVLALEPMVSLGDYRIKTLDDDWTVTSLDDSQTAHFEHTVAVTDKGCTVITQ
jgi:methionyl aminopeptidase